MDSSCKPVEKSAEGGMENGKAVEACGELEAAAGCCSCPVGSRGLPPEYRNELRELSKLAGPVVSKSVQYLQLSAPVRAAVLGLRVGMRRVCEGQTVFR